eukprot:SAG11_NODE_15472_length_577_cov_0.721757_2_plen_60_part_01
MLFRHCHKRQKTIALPSRAWAIADILPVHLDAKIVRATCQNSVRNFELVISVALGQDCVG